MVSLFAFAAALAPVRGTAAPAVQAAAAPLAHPLVKTAPVKASHVKVTPYGVAPKVLGGWTPATLTAAYGVTWKPTLGAGKTIAIIDAFDSQSAESGLGVFSAQFGLPACTSANGCFKKVNQVGNPSPMPAPNADWALEISLDVQWAHAMAPGAKILLVEARDSSFDNLNAAVMYANNISDATYLSNSWGAPEFLGQAAYDSVFTPKPGKSMLFASGDDGAKPASYPSSAPNVVSVGGTTLSTSGSVVTESVWVGGGGGCSKYALAPAAQLNFAQYKQAGCKKGLKATPDLAAIADPATGVGVVMNGAFLGFAVGGTSLATPVVAALAAGAGIPLNADSIYGTGLTFRDVNKSTVRRSKTNGVSCKVGFDMCTGRGSLVNMTAVGAAKRWK